jgi:hypothetical protein
MFSDAKMRISSRNWQLATLLTVAFVFSSSSAATDNNDPGDDDKNSYMAENTTTVNRNSAPDLAFLPQTTTTTAKPAGAADKNATESSLLNLLRNPSLNNGNTVGKKFTMIS